MKSFLSSAVVVCFVMTAATSVCSAKPSESDARKLVEEKIAAESEGRITLIRFKKTDEQEGTAPILGIPFYAMSFEMEIEFTSRCKWFHHPAVATWLRTEPVKQLKGWDKFNEDMQPYRAGEIVNAGDRKIISGDVYFGKSEKGWESKFNAESIKVRDGGKTAAETGAPEAGSAKTSARTPSSAEVARIVQNLDRIIDAGMACLLESGRESVTFAEIAQSDRTIAQIKPVSGESYKEIVVKPTTDSLTVTTASGRAVTLNR